MRQLKYLSFQKNKPVVFVLVNLLLIPALITSCIQQKKSPTEVNTTSEVYKFQPPGWSKNANIYEVNIRQYTPEGTFKAFESHLPRLKNSGVNILWLMRMIKKSQVKLYLPLVIHDTL